MLTLNVRVPEARDRAAIATLRDGFTTVLTDDAVATATPAIASMHGNSACDPLRMCGHPPFGRYVLLNHQPVPPDQAREYGSHLLLFQPMSGLALAAESFGRLALLVYSGLPGSDMRMRRTQGGLRLSDRMLNAIVSRLQPGRDLSLELEPLRAPSWWQFWKSQPVTQPLSGSLPALYQPPADEVSLLQALLQQSVRRTVSRSVGDDRDDLFERDRRDRWSSSSTTSGREAIQGGGGESGGGGASGGWDAPGREARPGVDSSGRIIGAAAAAGALGAMAGAAAASHGDSGAGTESADAGSGADTSTGTSY